MRQEAIRTRPVTFIMNLILLCFSHLAQFLQSAGGEQMGNRYPEKLGDTDQVGFWKSQIFSKKMLDSMSV